MSATSRAASDSQANSSDFQPAFTGWKRWALLAAFVLLVALRLPNAWTHGRFQDEEATVFLAYAWHFPWQVALFRSFAGYWNLGANASTVLLAGLVRDGLIPIERAPYFTMLLGLTFQAVPALLILTGRASWLANRMAVVAALLVIAISPATEEISFNVIHIQFYLALSAGIILALELPTGRVARVGYPLILFLAPLCGPGAIVILPLFALRWLVERERGRLVQLLTFSAGAAIQLLIFYGGSVARGHLADPGTVAVAMFLRQIVLPLGGIDLAARVGSTLYFSRYGGGAGWLWIAAVMVIIVAALLVEAVRRRDSAIWLLLAGLGISAASLGFGMVIAAPVSYFRVVDGERYNFLPNVLIGLALIVLATRPATRLRPFYLALCLIILVVGASQYRSTLAGFTDGPDWPGETRAWRIDHDHPLAVWPSPWAADLSDRAHPCTAPPTRKGRPGDPRYCESGWIAGFYFDRTAGSPAGATH